MKTFKIELLPIDFKGEYTNNIDCPLCRAVRRELGLPRGEVYVLPDMLYILGKATKYNGGQAALESIDVIDKYEAFFGGSDHRIAFDKAQQGESTFVKIKQLN